MKRIRVMLGFLLAGAIVNVAVAWGLAFLDEPNFDSSDLGTLHHWRSGNIEHSSWKPGIGRTYEQRKSVSLRRGPVGRDTDVLVTLSFGHGYSEQSSTYDFNYGIPFRSVAAEVKVTGWATGYDGGSGIKNFEVIRGIEVNHLRRMYIFAPTSVPVVLPVSPLWLGIMSNACLYAFMLWVFIQGPFAFRRFLRRKRGVCVKCGYDLKGAEHEVCPECGVIITGKVPA